MYEGRRNLVVFEVQFEGLTQVDQCIVDGLALTGDLDLETERATYHSPSFDTAAVSVWATSMRAV